jgi:hypothetical protein
LHRHQLFNRFQSGFRRHHSCKSAVLQISDGIRRLIDISRAFDTVIHNILLSKLASRFGFSQKARNFVGSYLHNRKSIIFSNNSQSTEISNTCGVPQGSILGPLFFCLYCEDMNTVFNHVGVHYYADDTQLFLSCAPEDFTHCVDRIDLSGQLGYMV